MGKLSIGVVQFHNHCGSGDNLNFTVTLAYLVEWWVSCCCNVKANFRSRSIRG